MPWVQPSKRQKIQNSTFVQKIKSHLKRKNLKIDILQKIFAILKIEVFMEIKGFTYGYSAKKGMYNCEKGIESQNELMKTGINWVCLAFPVSQKSYMILQRFLLILLIFHIKTISRLKIL